MSVRIVLADDQPIVRAGFRMLLDSEPDLEVVGTASDGREAVDQALRLRPDVVLMDVQMPRLDGVEATRRITAAPVDPPIRVLVLTTFDLDEYVFAAVRAGASGFVLKTIAPDELVDAVRTVAAGHALIAPEVTRGLIERFAELAVPVPARTDQALDRLTAREREVLTLIARGLSNSEIAGTLFVGESTVRTHVKHLLAKLGARDRVQAAIRAYEGGLVRPGRA